MTREVRAHPLLHQAAIIGRMFRLDPVVVLEEGDPYRNAARIAATQYVIDMENKAAEKSRSKR